MSYRPVTFRHLLAVLCLLATTATAQQRYLPPIEAPATIIAIAWDTPWASGDPETLQEAQIQGVLIQGCVTPQSAFAPDFEQSLADHGYTPPLLRAQQITLARLQATDIQQNALHLPLGDDQLWLSDRTARTQAMAALQQWGHFARRAGFHRITIDLRPALLLFDARWDGYDDTARNDDALLTWAHEFAVRMVRTLLRAHPEAHLSFIVPSIHEHPLALQYFLHGVQEGLGAAEDIQLQLHMALPEALLHNIKYGFTWVRDILEQRHHPVGMPHRFQLGLLLSDREIVSHLRYQYNWNAQAFAEGSVLYMKPGGALPPTVPWSKEKRLGQWESPLGTTMVFLEGETVGLYLPQGVQQDYTLTRQQPVPLYRPAEALPNLIKAKGGEVQLPQTSGPVYLQDLYYQEWGAPASFALHIDRPLSTAFQESNLTIEYRASSPTSEQLHLVTASNYTLGAPSEWIDLQPGETRTLQRKLRGKGVLGQEVPFELSIGPYQQTYTQRIAPPLLWESTHEAPIAFTPVFASIDTEAGEEILILGRRGDISCIDLRGTFLWRRTLKTFWTGAPAIGTGLDGRARIAIPAHNNTVWLLDDTGAVLRRIDLKGAPESLHFINPDRGPTDILCVYSKDQRLGVYSGDGRLLWEYHFDTPQSLYPVEAFRLGNADFNALRSESMEPVLLLTDTDGLNTHALNLDGTLRWTRTNPARPEAPATAITTGQRTVLGVIPLENTGLELFDLRTGLTKRRIPMQSPFEKLWPMESNRVGEDGQLLIQDAQGLQLHRIDGAARSIKLPASYQNIRFIQQKDTWTFITWNDTTASAWDEKGERLWTYTTPTSILSANTHTNTANGVISLVLGCMDGAVHHLLLGGKVEVPMPTVTLGNTN